jgi:putative ABC transport system permease protein
MSRTPWHLVWEHLWAHKVRTGLTLCAMLVALFLFCCLVSIVTTVSAAATSAAGNRLVVQSAVSLFVDLPRDYQPKIESVAGVGGVSKFQWFGGYYRELSNFFAQFGVDHLVFFDLYRRDIEIVEGPDGETGPQARAAVEKAMAADRRACVIAEGLRSRFGWTVGETVPLVGTIFQKNDNSSWEFNVVGIYRPLKSNVDNLTLWMRYDYIQEFLDAGLATGPTGVGVYIVNVADGYDPATVVEGIDRQFRSGPQVTMTSTEAAFQAGFASMLGNLPMFIGAIGGAVVFAVLFTLVNTMLMAGRQRTHEGGILKALGFRNGALACLMLTESLALSLLGGGLGIALAFASQHGMQIMLGSYFPNYHVASRTAVYGLGMAALVGVIAGIAPALLQARLRPTEALRSEG